MTHTSTEQERVSLPLDLVNDLLALCTPEDHELRERVKQAARRAQVVPEGWKLVPEEPTPAMYERAMREGYYHDDPKTVKAVLRAEYQDMLAAAPQPPEQIQPLCCDGRARCSRCSSQPKHAPELAPQPPESNSAEFDGIKTEATPVQLPEPVGVLRVFEPHEGAGVVCTEATINATNLSHGWHTLYTDHQVRQMLAHDESQSAAIMALKRCVRVLAGEEMSKSALIRALEDARSVLDAAQDSKEKAQGHDPANCWCQACDIATSQHGFRTRMSLCPKCGDKRCPRAQHHGFQCQSEKKD